MRSVCLKVAGVVLACVLSGCATVEVVNVERIDEVISGMVFDRDANMIYAAGTHYDYEIIPCVWGAYAGGKQVDEACQKTLHALTSAPLNAAIKDVKLRLSIRNGSDNEVSGDYRAIVFVGADMRTALAAQGLKTHTVGEADVLAINQAQGTQHNPEEAMAFRVTFEGRVVQLADREAVLSKGRLARPLLVNTQVSTIKRGRSVVPLFKGAAAVVMVPVMVVAILPMAAVLAYCEPGGRCS
ncbi:MAG: hypothetical protein KA214_03785 [Neisseriaceae bacterium]|nr:hypothetical protein [Neisseriaceae bacterium]